MTISTRTIIIASSAFAVAAITAGVAVVAWPSAPGESPEAERRVATELTPTPQPVPTDSDPTTAPDAPLTETSLTETEAMLLYMAEEEKLAYDVYVALGEQWGTRVFTQISASEATHQDRVVGLLDTLGLADPRTDVAGTFVDEELQSLYDELMELGSTSQAEAITVGVMIEQRDIADLTGAMSLTDDPTILTLLDSLREASYNHLAAFERQQG